MPSTRLVLTGATGLLGSAIVRAALGRPCDVLAVGGPATPLRRGDDATNIRWVGADFTEPIASLAATVEAFRPTAVLHAAAATNVDWCERHPRDAMRVNAEAVGDLAACAASAGASFAYVSTDAVFDGLRGGYVESDAPAPVNVYARTKLEGERFAMQAHASALVVRTTLFGRHPAGRGLADWMTSRLSAGRTVPAFADVTFSPLFADDLADILLDMLTRGLAGVFHVAARDACTKYEFGRMLAESLGYPLHLVEKAGLSDGALAAARPGNTRLSVAKVTAALGREMPTVREGISRMRRHQPTPVTES